MLRSLSISRRQAFALFGSFMGTELPSWAAVAAFPTRPILLISPYPPGGSTTVLGRLFAEHLFSESGQVAVVENVAGAAGNVGAGLVARAPADGYTLEIGTMSTHAMNGSLYAKLPFDPIQDFDTVALLAYAVNVIAVTASLPVNTFPELLAYLRANPGKLNYASGGIGSHNHLTLALLARTVDLDIVHVPYKGAAPAVTALLQGECQLYAGSAALLLPHMQAGKVRIIAVTEKTRAELLPDVPSVAETLKDFEVTNWYGVFAPRGLAPERRAQLNQEFNRVAALPDTTHRLKGLGMFQTPLSPLQLRKVLEADHALWSRTITQLQITAE